MSDVELFRGELPVTLDGENYSDVALDRKTLRDKKIRRSRFSALGLKEAKLTDCDFNHSTFEGCYFRKAHLRNVSFIGCTFKDCKFDGVILSDCRFDHAEFYNCSLTFDEFLPALEGPHHNIRWRLARTLRVNSQSRGDSESARKFLWEELRASEIYNYNKAFRWRHPYYGKKYRWDDRFAGFYEWSKSKFSSLCWGHGEKPLRVLLVSLAVLTIFAYVLWQYQLPLANTSSVIGFWDYWMFSFATLAGVSYGGIFAASPVGRILVVLERTLGLVFFGFFVATLYRSISKR